MQKGTSVAIQYVIINNINRTVLKYAILNIRTFSAALLVCLMDYFMKKKNLRKKNNRKFCVFAVYRSDWIFARNLSVTDSDSFNILC